MAWQFEEQEKENMSKVYGLGRFQTGPFTKPTVKFAYVGGYTNCNSQWLNDVKEFLKEQGVSDQDLRQVRDRESFIKILANHCKCANV